MHVTFQYSVISGLCNGAAFPLKGRNETPFVHARTETRNCSLQAFKHNTSSSLHAVSNEPGTAKALLIKIRNEDVLIQYSVFGQ